MSLPPDVVHSLAIPLTPMIGREREVAAVRALLRRDDVRMVTLIGPGGVGKTRLALAVAEAVAGDFSDGMRAVSLGTVSDASLVGPAIAQTVGLREAGDRPLVQQLADFLCHQELLLLLDSIERAADEASFLAELLSVCPGVKILVTSRLVLHLTAEHLFPVPPLIVPGPAPSALLEEDPRGSEAVRLFALRARAAAADFELTDENAVDVLDICRRLDGLPLAIELAAARVRLFPPATLLSRLERRLPMLTGGPRDAPARHRTQAATIAWSYELLDDPGRRWMRHLSVFAAGCTLIAAERVAGCDDIGISTLADHSLLHRIDRDGEEIRFAMLDTVREFAHDRLVESGEEEDVRRAHAAWCLELVTSARAALGGASQQRWLKRLTIEHGNLRAAMQAARSSGNGETLGRLAGALWRYWYGLGLFTEGRLWLNDALAAAAGLAPQERLELLIGSGTLAHAQSDEEQAVAMVEEGIALARREQDRAGLALVLNLSGVMARDHGDYDLAANLLEESLDLSRTLDNRWGIVLSINSLAILYQLRGDYDRAASLLEESAALASAQGDTWGTAQALNNMAHLSRRQGDFERAAALYEQSGELYRDIGDRRGEAVSLTNLGRLAERLGDLDRAITLHELSLDALRELGDRRGAATVLANLGVTYLRRGDLDRSERITRESLAVRHELGDREGVATSLETLAEVAAARDRAERALRLWASAAALRDAIGAPLAPSERASYDVVITSARASLGAETVAEMWAEGRLLSMAAAVGYAMQPEMSPEQPPRVDAVALRVMPSPASGLTPRELDVLRLLEVHTDREIADQLFIGPRTVATHVTNILNKLGVNSRTAAVAYAIRQGFI